MKINNDYKIINIHTNTRYPDVVYAELWKGNDLLLCATLVMCYERAESLSLEHYDEMTELV